MTDIILTAAGVKFRETRFLTPQKGTFAVYHDEVLDSDGPDDETRIFTHGVTVELYAPKPDPTAEKAIEAQLNARGLKWTKQPRYWLTEAKRYQVIYEFSYIKKI